MLRSGWRSVAVVSIFTLVVCGFAASQEESEESEETSAAPVAEQLQQAVFPAENPDLVFIEGEDAVTTNFANEAILNYSCSSSRALLICMVLS